MCSLVSLKISLAAGLIKNVCWAILILRLMNNITANGNGMRWNTDRSNSNESLQIVLTKLLESIRHAKDYGKF